MWNQEVVHGSVPNGSTAWRLAQFVKAFPSAPVGKERAQRRAAAVRAHVDRAGLLGSVTPLGRAVFGLDTAEGGQSPWRGARGAGTHVPSANVFASCFQRSFT